MSHQATKTSSKPTGCRSCLLVLGVLILFTLTLSFKFSLGGSSSSADCKKKAREELSRGDADFVEITNTSGHRVTGYVGRYAQGNAERVHNWECTTESGEAVITWYHPAG